jgi:SnoaL-like polyketide cyclase
MAAIAAAFRGAFPDLRMEVDLILSDGDLVAARWTSAGTFSGPWGDTSPTGVRATFSGVNIFRIRDGRVVELWNHRDDLGLMEQVGAPVFAGSPAIPRGLPPTPPAAAASASRSPRAGRPARRPGRRGSGVR